MDISPWPSPCTAQGSDIRSGDTLTCNYDHKAAVNRTQLVVLDVQLWPQGSCQQDTTGCVGFTIMTTRQLSTGHNWLCWIYNYDHKAAVNRTQLVVLDLQLWPQGSCQQDNYDHKAAVNRTQLVVLDLQLWPQGSCQQDITGCVGFTIITTRQLSTGQNWLCWIYNYDHKAAANRTELVVLDVQLWPQGSCQQDNYDHKAAVSRTIMTTRQLSTGQLWPQGSCQQDNYDHKAAVSRTIMTTRQLSAGQLWPQGSCQQDTTGCVGFTIMTTRQLSTGQLWPQGSCQQDTTGCVGFTIMTTRQLSAGQLWPQGSCQQDNYDHKAAVNRTQLVVLDVQLWPQGSCQQDRTGCVGFTSHFHVQAVMATSLKKKRENGRTYF